MYASLIQHRWKEFLRKGVFRENWGVKILLTLVVLYFGGSFVLLGVYLPEILKSALAEGEGLHALFSGFVLYYLLADLIFRFFMQNLSVLSVQHYLTQPIAKKKVLHFLLQSSVFNFFNILPLFILLPWGFQVVLPEYGTLNLLAWLMGMLGLMLCNHYLAIYLKRALAVKGLVVLAAALVVVALAYADYQGWLPLQELSKAALLATTTQYWPLAIILALLLMVYRLNLHFLLRFTYLDQWQETSAAATAGRFSFLEERGVLGTLMANELKLILRNRRPRAMLMITGLFLFYGLIFYTQEEMGSVLLVFVGILTSGIFLVNYGQFLGSWESAFFDGILTRSLSLKEHYLAKYYLLNISAILLFTLSLPYVYFGWEVIFINAACLLYNMGVNSQVILFTSTYNKKPIDLSRGAAFNYQGTGAAQFLIVLPIIALPMLVYQGFNVFGLHEWGLVTLALMGLLGLAFRRYLINEVVRNFQEKKYKIAAGYRAG